MNIALYGFMGVGKTTIGSILAEKLGYCFIDVDKEIERETGKSINEIFKLHGEAFFRKLESEIIRELSKKDRLVIACGGGLVLNKINIDRLRESSEIVYLTASPEVILKRTSSKKGQRPLLEVEKPALTISEMLGFRKPFYERAADVTIDTSRLNIDAVARQIIDKLGKR